MTRTFYDFITILRFGKTIVAKEQIYYAKIAPSPPTEKNLFTKFLFPPLNNSFYFIIQF